MSRSLAIAMNATRCLPGCRRLCRRRFQPPTNWRARSRSSRLRSGRAIARTPPRRRLAFPAGSVIRCAPPPWSGRAPGLQRQVVGTRRAIAIWCRRPGRRASVGSSPAAGAPFVARSPPGRGKLDEIPTSTCASSRTWRKATRRTSHSRFWRASSWRGCSAGRRSNEATPCRGPWQRTTLHRWG